jgi:hypothetical protein
MREDVNAESGWPTTGGERMRAQDQHGTRPWFDVADIEALLRAASDEEPFMTPDEQRDALVRVLRARVRREIA